MKRWQNILSDLKKEFLIREKELETLHEIDKHILDKQITLNETYNHILKKTKDLLESKHAQLLIRKGANLEIVASTDPSHIGDEVLITDSISGISIQSSKITNCANVNKGKYRELYKGFLGTAEEPIISELVIPIIVDNSPIGVINVESSKEIAFKAEDERMANTLTTQAALAISHSRLFDEVTLFKKTEQLLFSDSCDTPLQRMLHIIICELKKFLPIQLVQILFRKGNDSLEIAYSSNPEDVGISAKISDSVSGRAIQEKKLIFVEDVSKDPKYKRMLGINVRSEIVIPILSQGEAVGVINIESTKTGIFDPYFQYVLQRFSQEVSNIFMLAKLKEDLQKSREYQEATDILVALGDQTGNIIHRLNNIVGAMKVGLKEIQFSCKKDLDNNEFLQERINEILEGAEETLRLPQELKKMIRIDFVDINAILIEMLNRIHLPKNIKVELILDKELPKVKCYSFDIVARNLIRNAIDAMPDGGCLKIFTKLVSYSGIDDKKIEVKVQDTGKGIPKNIIHKIFDINFTSKKEKDGKGLGFGLWWIKKFVIRVKGNICVQSKEGEGTTFNIKLPISE